MPVKHFKLLVSRFTLIVHTADVGSASLPGKRKENEDRFIVKELQENLVMFAIFDGHGGSKAVEFVHQNIENHIRYWLKQTDSLREVLRKTFTDVNNMLSKHLAFQGKHVSNIHRYFWTFKFQILFVLQNLSVKVSIGKLNVLDILEYITYLAEMDLFLTTCSYS